MIELPERCYEALEYLSNGRGLTTSTLGLTLREMRLLGQEGYIQSDHEWYRITEDGLKALAKYKAQPTLSQQIFALKDEMKQINYVCYLVSTGHYSAREAIELIYKMTGGDK